MLHVPVLYTSRFWIAPAGRQALFDWLDGGHMQEVVSQPGFRFGQRIRLEQPAEDGWEAYMMIYGLDSMEALQAYQANTALHEKFARQRAPFAQHLRMERAWGTVEMVCQP